MQRIDKQNFKAVDFQQELAEFEQANSGNHPDYERGGFRDKHYLQVYLALLICQKGVCAYTESELFRDYGDLTEDWDNGVYTGDHESRIGFSGTIDHFEHALKKTKGWQLDNLFLIKNDINNDKGVKPVLNFMNPGRPDYSPHKYLFYSFEQHKFYPKSNLPEHVSESEVQYMIDVLGLNAPSVLSERKGYLNDFKTDLKFETKTYDYIREHEHYKFFTALEMSATELQGE